MVRILFFLSAFLCLLSTSQNITASSHDSAPSFQCPEELVVALTNDASANRLFINRRMFTSVSADEVAFEVRRLAPACGEDNTAFGPSIPFCCEDKANGFVIEVRSLDATNTPIDTCSIQVMLQDKLEPKIIARLPDFEISCTTRYAMDDLSIFGSYRTVDSLRRDIRFTEKDTVRIAGRDGLVGDVCGIEIVEKDTLEFNDCRVGRIVRIFSLKDDSGLTAVDTQYITVKFDDVFDPTTINWPSMYVQYACPGSIPTPEEAGKPEFTNNSCSLLSVPDYEDEVYIHPNGGCNKVIRKWKIVDWCIYDGSSSMGRYTHNQIIKILDTIPPKFTGQPTEVEVPIRSSVCEAQARLKILATENCSSLSTNADYNYELDISADGTIDHRGRGASFSYTLPKGDHRVIWYAKDHCGNVGSHSQIIRVVDKTAPSLVCTKGLSAALTRMVVNGSVTGMTELWAKDFLEYGIDNCDDSKDIVYSFSSDVNDKNRVYTCDSIGRRSVRIYATDLSGNQDYCETEIDIQNNSGACPTNTSNMEIQGRVVTAGGVPVSDVEMTLASKTDKRHYMTDDEGAYVFDELKSDNKYMLTSSRDKNARDGINVRDLLAIQRHILGMNTIDNPYDLIAADADNSGRIDAKDLLSLRKVILKIDDEFKNNSSWRFYSKDQSQGELKDYLEIDHLDHSMSKADFVGVKIGDVDRSLEGKMRAGKRSSSSTPLYYTMYESFGGKVIDFFVAPEDIYAFQASLNFGRGTIERVYSSILNLEDSDYTAHEGRLDLAVAKYKGIQNPDNQPLFTVVLSGNITMPALEDNLEGIIVNNRDEVEDIFLQPRSSSKSAALFQNAPNPFKDKTEIGFFVEKAGKVTFSLYDLSGKLLLQKSDQYPEGKNTLMLKGSEIKSSGVLILDMSTPTTSRRIKMIKMK